MPREPDAADSETCFPSILGSNDPSNDLDAPHAQPNKISNHQFQSPYYQRLSITFMLHLPFMNQTTPKFIIMMSKKYYCSFL